MKIQRGFEDSAGYRGGYLSIGNFDGVHRGHQRMLQTLVSLAHRAGVPAVAMTFEPHPLNLLAPDRAPARLATPEHKAELIAACGVDCLIVYPTDQSLLNLTASEFFEQIVRNEIDARGIVEGPNFCFGRGRAGTIEVLQAYCDAAHIELTIAEAVSVGSSLVSSSGIRQAILRGHLREAVAMLGHPYRLTGIVSRGAGRGKQIGFGTANLEQIATLLPADGVYAGTAEVDGQRYAAAINCGPNPTFGENARKVEAHLIGFPDRDLYGDRLSVDLLAHIRDTRPFSGVEALRAQLTEDIQRVAEIAAAQP
jgi:riboflavin kinase/FMN adenylyltransferase